MEARSETSALVYCVQHSQVKVHSPAPMVVGGGLEEVQEKVAKQVLK